MAVDGGAKKHSEAILRLRLLYTLGTEVDKNPQKAVELFLESISYGNKNLSNNADAQNLMGLFSFKSKKDYERAIEWFQMAAAQGHAESQYYLGSLYIDKHAYFHKQNTGDLQRGIELLLASSKNGSIRGSEGLASAYNYRLDDQKTALPIYIHMLQLKQCGESKHAIIFSEVQYAVASCLFDGIHVTQDRKMAIELFGKSAKQGHTSSMRKLEKWFSSKDNPAPSRIDACVWIGVIAKVSGDSLDVDEYKESKGGLSELELNLVNQRVESISEPILKKRAECAPWWDDEGRITWWGYLLGP